MPFNRPSLSQIQTRVQADMLARIGGSTPALRRGVLGVLSSVLAAAVHALYGAVQYRSQQAVPGTAEADDLARWASFWGITRRQPTAAAGGIEISGEVGAQVFANTRLQSPTGVEYRTLATVTVPGGGMVTASVVALTAGAVTNQVAGIVLSFVSPPVGIDVSAMVTGDGLSGGGDIEADDSLRARLVDRISNPPHGGSAADYVFWALQTPNVSRAWVFPLYDGPGTVRVYIADDAFTTTTRVAATATVTAAQTFLDSQRPVTVEVDVVAPLRQPLNFTIAVSPNTAEIRAAVAANLADLLRAEAAPEAVVLISHIREAISQARGEFNHVLTTPTADVTAAAGAIVTLGTITWA